MGHDNVQGVTYQRQKDCSTCRKGLLLFFKKISHCSRLCRLMTFPSGLQGQEKLGADGLFVVDSTERKSQQVSSGPLHPLTTWFPICPLGSAAAPPRCTHPSAKSESGHLVLCGTQAGVGGGPSAAPRGGSCVCWASLSAQWCSQRGPWGTEASPGAGEAEERGCPLMELPLLEGGQP